MLLQSTISNVVIVLFSSSVILSLASTTISCLRVCSSFVISPLSFFRFLFTSRSTISVMSSWLVLCAASAFWRAYTMLARTALTSRKP
jgi:hypothetical protein